MCDESPFIPDLSDSGFTLCKNKKKQVHPKFKNNNKTKNKIKNNMTKPVSYEQFAALMQELSDYWFSMVRLPPPAPRAQPKPLSGATTVAAKQGEL